jgi:hypothetical protein
MNKGCPSNTLGCIGDSVLAGTGPWNSLSGQQDCPNMGLNLDGGGRWGTCKDNLLIKALYRESSGE